MKKLTCDTCGRDCQGLNELKDEYRADDVVEVCDNCLKELQGVLDKIRIAQRIQLRKMMRDAVRVFKWKMFG